MQLARISLYTALSIGSYFFIFSNILEAIYVQVILSLSLAVVMGFEFSATRYPYFSLPPTVFSVYCMVQNMLSGVLHLGQSDRLNLQVTASDDAILLSSWYTLVAVQMLWVSFHLFEDCRVSWLRRISIRSVSKSSILILTGISIVTFLAGMQFGIYGYAASSEDFGLLSYMRAGVSLGLLAIILTTIYYYDDVLMRGTLYILIVINIFMGLFFGSKAAAVLPLLFFLITFYLTGRRIPKIYWAFVPMLIVISYAVVEPFRMYHQLQLQGQGIAGVDATLSAYVDAQTLTSGQDTDYASSFLRRQNYALPLAKTIEFADKNDYYHSEEWGNLLLSPLYAIVPRLLWSSKPIINFGTWASVNIFGFSETTATGVTPQGYAYLVGRGFGILFFFLLSGLVQRLLFNSLYQNRSLLPFYILMYLEIGYPGVVPSQYISGTIQTLILLSPVVYWLWRAGARVEPWSQNK
jgi:hypothetical protein